MIRLALVLTSLLLEAACSMKVTPTRNVREMAEAAIDPGKGWYVNPNDIHVSGLNQAFSNPTYTCPQHRAVRSKKPGLCHCGLHLVAMPRGSPMPEVQWDVRREEASNP